jgi:hypothetical protein
MEAEIDYDNLYKSPIASPMASEKSEKRIFRLVKKRKPIQWESFLKFFGSDQAEKSQKRREGSEQSHSKGLQRVEMLKAVPMLLFWKRAVKCVGRIDGYLWTGLLFWQLMSLLMM